LFGHKQDKDEEERERNDIMAWSSRSFANLSVTKSIAPPLSMSLSA